MRAAGSSDPVEAMTSSVRRVLLDALDRGWVGPPYDPLTLADLLHLQAVARADVPDARTVPAAAGKLRIEFNPNQPRGRLRYSVAHEIAHTLFADCAEQVRHRTHHADLVGDEWQLEALCNLGAAEILMPFGSLPDLGPHTLGIEHVLAFRKRFEVSTEAILNRVVRLAEHPCAMFVASRIETDSRTGRYQLDYMIGSWGWLHRLPTGYQLPSSTKLAECTAIGFTTTADETWGEKLGCVHVEAVGVPAYPGARFPRVAGLLRHSASSTEDVASPSLRVVRGSATKPRGEGPQLVVQVVNDQTSNWGGGGFAQAVRTAWPEVQEDFRLWAEKNPRAFALGGVRIAALLGGISVASIIAQKGYGAARTARIRYGALREGLEKVAEAASQAGTSIHMPRIGTGHAGGAWDVIEELVRKAFCDRGLSVTVYDLPDAPPPQERAQLALLPT
jgi:O-acetyl-ADP-ribose deacetylase (regulator of RNase III)